MYDYFFLSECERMKIYIHDIKTEENRKKFENIVQNIQKYLKKYNIHKINEFVRRLSHVFEAEADCFKLKNPIQYLQKHHCFFSHILASQKFLCKYFFCVA